MDKAKIMKKLKQRYNYLESQGYQVLYIALQGSQNYNMDLYTEDYKSDLDCKAIILPKIDEFISNKSPVSTTIVLDNNEHIDIKDIREMFSLFRRQNVQFLEILFTEYRIINKDYKEYVLDLIKMREDIAMINTRNIFNGISGIAKQKYVALCHPYPSIIDKIEKYGYDGKQLHHLIRLSQFIRNLDSGMSFKESLTYFDDDIRQLCIDTKLNKYSLEEAKQLADIYLAKVDEVKAKYSYLHTDDNEFILEKLNKIKEQILKLSFTRELLPEVVDNKLDINKYKHIWFTSDTHFGHINIMQYEHRYTKMNVKNIEEHDRVLIDNWNNKVGKNDLIFILGDFSFRNAEETMEILNKLNGDKILIEGNHDCIFLQSKKFDKSLFKEICDYKEIHYRGRNLCLMHYPISQFKHLDKETNFYIHLHGHIHSIPYVVPRHSYNVGADVNNYTPVSFEEVLLKAEENTGGKINGQL